MGRRQRQERREAAAARRAAQPSLLAELVEPRTQTERAEVRERANIVGKAGVGLLLVGGLLFILPVPKILTVLPLGSAVAAILVFLYIHAIQKVRDGVPDDEAATDSDAGELTPAAIAPDAE